MQVEIEAASNNVGIMSGLMALFAILWMVLGLIMFIDALAASSYRTVWWKTVILGVLCGPMAWLALVLSMAVDALGCLSHKMAIWIAE